MACLTDAELSAAAADPFAALPTAQAGHLAQCADCRHRLDAARSSSLETEVTDGGPAPLVEGVIPVSGDRYALHSLHGAAELLGRGGYGQVLLARDLAVGRDVALKCLRSRPDVTDEKRRQAEARLLREARVVGQLEHPAIVPLYDFGRTPEGRLFYTMRRIHGRTLAQAVKEAPDFTARLRLLPHVLAACHALAYAHTRGVLHRDLKPQNVMVDRFGQTAVIDWVLASARGLERESGDDEALRLVGEDETLSDGRGRLGTPACMSPEQLLGKREEIDERTDVWGLGGLLYEVLTAKSPRDRESLKASPPVRELAPDCPTDLATLCDKALSRERAARYPSAEAMAGDLDAWLHGRLVSSHVYRRAERLKRFVRAQQVALTVGTIAAVLLAVVGITSFQRVTEERNRARAFGLSLLGDVLPRMTSLGDYHFLTRFTARVQDWLEHTGAGDDDAAVARAWLRLAINAEATDLKTMERFADRCLALSRGLPPGRERYALELGCETARLDALTLTPSARAEGSEALWARAPADGSDDDVLALEARFLLAMRRGWYANSQARIDVEEQAMRAALELSQRWIALAPDDPLAHLAYGEALANTAVALSNQREGARALATSAASLAEAQKLLTMTRSEQALLRLGESLLIELGTRRWFAADDRAGLEAVAKQARLAHEAALTLAPKSTPARMGLMQLYLDTAQREPLAAVLDDFDAEPLAEEGQGLWLFATLLTGRSAEALEHRAWLEEHPTFDVWLGFALAALETGDRPRAVEWLRKAAEQPPATSWPIDAMRACGPSVTKAPTPRPRATSRPPSPPRSSPSTTRASPARCSTSPTRWLQRGRTTPWPTCSASPPTSSPASSSATPARSTS